MLSRNKAGRLSTVLLVGQVVFVVLFAVFVKYDYNTGPTNANTTHTHTEDAEEFDLELYYPSMFIFFV